MHADEVYQSPAGIVLIVNLSPSPADQHPVVIVKLEQGCRVPSVPSDRPTRQACTVTLTYIYIYIYIYLCICHVYLCICMHVSCIFMHISSLHKGGGRPSAARPLVGSFMEAWNMHKYVNIYIKCAYICINIHEIRINIHKSAIFEYQTSQGPSDKPTRQDCTVTSPDNPGYNQSSTTAHLFNNPMIRLLKPSGY